MNTAIIKSFSKLNPGGLIEFRPAMTILEYCENLGFDLENINTVFVSKMMFFDDNNWFAFEDLNLKNIINFKKYSNESSPFVYILEAIKLERVHCYLVLNNTAYSNILNNSEYKILKIHEFYGKFWLDYIYLNMN